jgi:hypothetical protein
VNEGTLDPRLLLFTDEAWFNLNGRVNMHNNHYRSSENLRVLHEAPFHDSKVGVWCAISVRRTIGRILVDTLNSERYFNLILNKFSPI